MNKYEIKLISERKFGIITYQYYQVVNYDGDKEALEVMVKKLNDDSLFNIDWYIDDAEKGILEKMIDTLD